MMGQDPIDWPRMLDEIVGNIRNKFSLLLALRVGLPYHRFIGSSVHRFIGSSVHRAAAAPWRAQQH